MEICHICFDKKDTQEKEIYCSHCSPFICSECLVLWKKDNQKCPICKRQEIHISIVIIEEETRSEEPLIPSETQSISNRDVEYNQECTKYCILKKTILVYIVLLVSGFIYHISIDAYEGKDVYKYTQFYLKEPITYVIFPLIGAYMIITISLIVLPVIYLCRAILIGR